MPTTPDTTPDGRTETETITIPVAPPRDPTTYDATAHFRNRLRERVDTHRRDSLPATLIRSGRVRCVPRTQSTDLPDPEPGSAVAFTTATVTGRPWTLVAALRPRAFVDDDEQHRAITIYQGPPRTADGGGDA
jgi:hypothetical protein